MKVQLKDVGANYKHAHVKEPQRTLKKLKFSGSKFLISTSDTRSCYALLLETIVVFGGKNILNNLRSLEKLRVLRN